jgi:hypothetical protein
VLQNIFPIPHKVEEECKSPSRFYFGKRERNSTMIKYSAILLGCGLTLAAFTAAAQPAAPAKPAASPAAASAASPAANPTALAPAADIAAQRAEESAKAERRAKFDLRATEEGDKLNDVKKQIETLITQNADATAKSSLEVQQQRQAVIDATKAVAQARQELVGALKSYDQATVPPAEAAVADAQFECELAQALLNAVTTQASIVTRIGDGALDPRVRDAAKKVLDGVKAGVQLQRDARELVKKTAQATKQQQNLQDDLEIQILTIMKEQRAKSGN